MPEPIPAEAVQVAAKASSMHFEFCDEPRWQDCQECVQVAERTERALKAAAPFIAASTLIQERRRALRLVRRRLVPRGCTPTPDAAQLMEAIKGDLRV